MSAANRVLVLGGLGFIGASVSRQLAAQGREVTALSRSLAPHAATTRSLTAAGVRVVEGNVGDSSLMAAVVRQSRPDREPRRASPARSGAWKRRSTISTETAAPTWWSSMRFARTIPARSWCSSARGSSTAARRRCR